VRQQCEPETSVGRGFQDGSAGETRQHGWIGVKFTDSVTAKPEVASDSPPLEA